MKARRSCVPSGAPPEQRDTASLADLDDRLRSRIGVDLGTGCWHWLGTRTSKGYGVVGWGGVSSGAHRAVWRELVGEIPDGLVLDHLCRVRDCCNPAHLEPVTPAENSRRGENMGPRVPRSTKANWDSIVQDACGKTCGLTQAGP